MLRIRLLGTYIRAICLTGMVEFTWSPLLSCRGVGRQNEVAEEFRPAARDTAQHRVALRAGARPEAVFPRVFKGKG